MTQQQSFRLRSLRQEHRVGQLQVRFYRLVSRERTLHEQQVGAPRKFLKLDRRAGIRSVDEHTAAFIRQANGKAFSGVRRSERQAVDPRQQFKFITSAHFFQLDGKRLLQQTIVIRFVNRLEDVYKT